MGPKSYVLMIKNKLTGGAMESRELQKIRSTVVARGYASATDCYIEKAIGSTMWDAEGKEYIDFSGGIAVMNVGHSHPKVVAAIKDQAEKFTHTCFMVMPYEPAIRLAEKLSASTPGDFPKAVLFANSGAEAVENAVKIARYHTNRQAIIAFEGAFHGRTYLGMSLTSKVKPYKYGFGPFVPEIYRIPYGYCYRCPFNLSYPSCDTACAEQLNAFFISHIDAENVAALIFEPVQGEGGFICPPPTYFQKLKKICDEHGILTIADEIQTGFGRTGTMFAMEQWGVAADITTSAKSLAAGLPLSAVIGRKTIMDSVHAGGVGGTYGGNPLSCRAALAVFDVFESENLLDKSVQLGKKLSSALNEFKERYESIGDVRGLGAMMAMELVKDRKTKAPAPDAAKDLVAFCRQKGLIILACGTYSNVIRLLMPLTISDEQLERGLQILNEGLAAVNKG
jgi:4-aminobutyrate aminotransferase/(S)-3-amino-2-methylpropionate transaminase